MQITEIPGSFEKSVDGMPKCRFSRVTTTTTNDGRKAYVYKRDVIGQDRSIGYEVVIPRIPKASSRQLPNGTVIETDGKTEVYPTSAVWGRYGWGPFHTLDHAIAKIRRLG